jgi:hypothetical protein
MDLKELNDSLGNLMNEQNNRMMPDFEGYSPYEMHQILHFTFGLNSPMHLQTIPAEDYKRIPVVNLVRYLTSLIADQGELKLTARGYLPVKVVADIYSQGFYKDEYIESGLIKLYKETDSMSIHLTRILVEISGLAKKRNGKLSLTSAAKKYLADDSGLLMLILITFTSKYNWAYFDGYGENSIGQLGYGFSLILLSKYGEIKRSDKFYAEKYFKAFPQLMEQVAPSYNSRERNAYNCYSIRTFDRFLDYFGLIVIENEGMRMEREKFIMKTALFDKLIKLRPHAIFDLKPERA